MTKLVFILILVTLPTIFGYFKNVRVSINPNVQCKRNYKYRTYDGTCNNPFRPTLGAVNTTYSRILPARYKDGLHLLYQDDLPSPRKLSITIFENVPKDDDKYSTLFMTYGQLKVHDVLITLRAPGVVGSCCNVNHPNFEEVCCPISVPACDDFYLGHNVSCLSMVRHKSTYNLGLSDGVSEQINEQTHFVDNSEIYGPSDRVAKTLRTFKNGKLKTAWIDGKEYLPTDGNMPLCTVDEFNKYCFNGGDIRVNQHPGLVVLTTIMVLFHNRIAGKLADINPHWDDETLYQEARRISIACNQHILYDEWLPQVMGSVYMKEYDLVAKKTGFTKYIPNLDPSVLNSFGACASRYLHSIIKGLVQLNDIKGYNQQHVNLSNVLNVPEIVHLGNNFNFLLNGACHQRMAQPSNSMTSELSTKLFKQRHQPFGSDLASLDCMRGRDHGLPSYVDALKIFFDYNVNDWSDFLQYISKERIELMKKVYKSPFDVELIIGGFLETDQEDSELGPTFAHIWKEQFYRWKYGDRFFYEHYHEHGFTEDQLQEIRKITMATVMCEGGHAMSHVYARPFEAPSKTNYLIRCSQLPKLNLHKWKEVSYKRNPFYPRYEGYF